LGTGLSMVWIVAEDVVSANFYIKVVAFFPGLLN
jgi:hypothetical protein